MNGCSIDDEDIPEFSQAVTGKTISGVRKMDGMNDNLAIDFTDGTSLALNSEYFIEWALVEREYANGGEAFLSDKGVKDD
jgi:hypothetical protein